MAVPLVALSWRKDRPPRHFKSGEGPGGKVPSLDPSFLFWKAWLQCKMAENWKRGEGASRNDESAVR